MTPERLKEISEWVNDKYVCHSELDLIYFRELLAEIKRLRDEDAHFKSIIDWIVGQCPEDSPWKRCINFELAKIPGAHVNSIIQRDEAWKQRDEARVQLGDAHLEIGKLREKLKVAEEALKFCKDYDRSPEPEYGETVRGHKPGVGQRFLTPKEKARITLEALSKIRGEDCRFSAALEKERDCVLKQNAELHRTLNNLREKLAAVEKEIKGLHYHSASILPDLMRPSKERLEKIRATLNSAEEIQPYMQDRYDLLHEIDALEEENKRFDKCHLGAEEDLRSCWAEQDQLEERIAKLRAALEEIGHRENIYTEGCECDKYAQASLAEDDKIRDGR